MKTDTFEPAFHELIESDDLIEVLGKFPLTIARMQQLEINNLKRHIVDDDIPF